MNPLWRYYLPGYIFALPLTLVGLLLAVYYWPGHIRFSSGCIEMTLREHRHLIGGRWVGGQTFGNVIFYRDERARDKVPLRCHERVHTWQAMVWTAPGLVISYGVSALWNIRKIRKDVSSGYRHILAEKQAYRIGAKIAADPSLDYWGSR